MSFPSLLHRLFKCDPCAVQPNQRRLQSDVAGSSIVLRPFQFGFTPQQFVSQGGNRQPLNHAGSVSFFI
jgi:hypothetical protein